MPLRKEVIINLKTEIETKHLPNLTASLEKVTVAYEKGKISTKEYTEALKTNQSVLSEMGRALRDFDSELQSIYTRQQKLSEATATTTIKLREMAAARRAATDAEIEFKNVALSDRISRLRGSAIGLAGAPNVAGGLLPVTGMQSAQSMMTPKAAANRLKFLRSVASNTPSMGLGGITGGGGVGGGGGGGGGRNRGFIGGHGFTSAPEFVAVGAATLVGRELVSSAATFEKSMANVRAVTEATNTDFSKLSSLAIDLSKNSVFSANQIAEGMTLLGKAGLSTEDIFKAIEPSIRLAEGTGEDFGMVARGVTDIISQFGMSMSDTQKVSDILATTLIQSKADIKDLIPAFVQGGAASKALGVSLEETATIFNLFAQSGIKGSAAGTALRNVLLSIEEIQRRDVFEELGLSAEAVSIKANGLTGVLDNLKAASLSNSDILQIFRRRGMVPLITLMEAGTAKIDQMTASVNEFGAAQRLAMGVTDNLTDSLTKAKNTAYAPFLEVWMSAKEPMADVLNIISEIADTEFGKQIIFFTGAMISLVGAIGTTTIAVKGLARMLATVAASAGTATEAQLAAGEAGSVAAVGVTKFGRALRFVGLGAGALLLLTPTILKILEHEGQASEALAESASTMGGLTTQLKKFHAEKLTAIGKASDEELEILRDKEIQTQKFEQRALANRKDALKKEREILKQDKDVLERMAKAGDPLRQGYRTKEEIRFGTGFDNREALEEFQKRVRAVDAQEIVVSSQANIRTKQGLIAQASADKLLAIEKELNRRKAAASNRQAELDRREREKLDAEQRSEMISKGKTDLKLAETTLKKINKTERDEIENAFKQMERDEKDRISLNKKVDDGLAKLDALALRERKIRTEKAATQKADYEERLVTTSENYEISSLNRRINISRSGYQKTNLMKLKAQKLYERDIRKLDKLAAERGVGMNEDILKEKLDRQEEYQAELIELEKQTAGTVAHVWESAMNAVEQSTADAFTAMILDGKKFADAMKDLQRSVIRASVQSVGMGIGQGLTSGLSQAAGSAMGGGGTGGGAMSMLGKIPGLGSLFGGGAATAAPAGASTAAAPAAGGLGMLGILGAGAALGGIFRGGMQLGGRGSDGRNATTGIGAIAGLAIGGPVGAVAVPLAMRALGITGGASKTKIRHRRARAAAHAMLMAEIERQKERERAGQQLQTTFGGGLMTTEGASGIAQILSGGISEAELQELEKGAGETPGVLGGVIGGPNTNNVTMNNVFQVRTGMDINLIAQQLGQQIASFSPGGSP